MENVIPIQELKYRWKRCRTFIQEYIPDAKGIILFSRLNIYYFCGTFGNGLLWLPLEGEPILLCRRGAERAKLESPLNNIFSFTSYKDVEEIFAEAGSELPKNLAVEMNGLSWALSNSFTRHLKGHEFIPGDKIIAMTRAKKSGWELEILRKAGASHAKCLTELLPPLLHEGMSELEIAHIISKLFFSQGHHGILRMEDFGEEVFLGHISIGDSANYPSVFNGPVGLRGAHPAIPFMGSEKIAWKPGVPLIIDNAFTMEGYQTDKTQVYWLGDQNSIPSSVQDAHNFCIELQDWIAAHLKPGVLPSDLWSHCMANTQKRGWSKGFMGLGKNKVDFVGHGIGLAIDEYPVLANGFDLPLEEGMVLAIEPKIGIPDVGMVGVENTFEVTPQGGKCLTGENYNMICVPVL